jgi:hypothetical protein
MNQDEPSRATQVLVTLVILLFVPISILNLASLPVGAAWLVILGRWKIVLLGFFAALLGGIIIGLLTHPFFWLQALAAYTVKNGRTLRRQIVSVQLLAVSYICYAVVFAGWGLLVFAIILRAVPENEIIPAFFLAFSVGVWPPQSMMGMNQDRSIQENLTLVGIMSQMCAFSAIRVANVYDLRWYITAGLAISAVFVPIQVLAAWSTLRIEGVEH